MEKLDSGVVHWGSVARPGLEMRLGSGPPGRTFSLGREVTKEPKADLGIWIGRRRDYGLIEYGLWEDRQRSLASPSVFWS